MATQTGIPYSTNGFILTRGEEHNIVSFLNRFPTNADNTVIDFSGQPFLIPFATLSLLIWIRNQLNAIWLI